MAKINVGILFGGQSTEHEVSLQSARNVYEAIDRDKYNVTLIGIDRGGHWHLEGEINPRLVNPEKSRELMLIPGEMERQLVSAPTGRSIGQMDVIFPILHGANGEDGTVQGLLRLLNIPFVGADVLGSAVAMDKHVANTLLKAAGLAVAKWLTITGPAELDFATAQSELGLPMFIKPANAGSSVGVTKVNNEAEFQAAIAKAFTIDTKVLVEEAIVGRELEMSVLGNDKPVASVAGEIILNTDFYSYDAKYINSAEVKIPAELEAETLTKMQAMAIKAFKALSCEGMARVDFFFTEAGELLINEINTIPGFTNISMYPKLWEASGLSYSALIDRLIELAIERHERKKGLTFNLKSV
jgi:D-alanine-D-alanine ligase